MKASEAFKAGNFSHSNWDLQGPIVTVTIITNEGLKGTFQLEDDTIINDNELLPAVPNFVRVYEAPRAEIVPEQIPVPKQNVWQKLFKRRSDHGR